MSTATVEFDCLTFRYPGGRAAALRCVSMAIGGGECVVLRGDVGSGKSTALAALAGFVPLVSGGSMSGSVRVAGLSPVHAGVARMAREVSYLPQLVEGFGVAPTALREIASGLELAGIGRADIAGRVAATAESLGIGAILARRLDTLSGGERQLVALAAALARSARVYALDEPLAQLHPASAARVLQFLLGRAQSDDAVMVLAEHEPVASPSDRLVMRQLDHGSLLESGDTCMSLPGPGAKSPLPAFGQRVVDISGLVVRRGGNLALSGFEFEAREGEVVALVGSNGSGKTTVLRTIAGLLTAEAGRVFVGRSGASGASFSLRSRDIGLLPQNASSLFFLDTVAQDLAYAPAASPGTVAELDPSLMSGLSGFLDRHPLDLSAGQRQWLGLALIERARPRLLLLDEPTRGLHASDRQRLGVYLRRRSAQGATVVIASHDWRFVADFADSFYELDKGRVIRLGAASQLVA